VNTFTWIYQVSLVFVVYTQFVTIMLGDKGWITTCFRWTGKKFIFNTLVLKVQTLKPSKVIKLFFTKYLTMYDLYIQKHHTLLSTLSLSMGICTLVNNPQSNCVQTS